MRSSVAVRLSKALSLLCVVALCCGLIPTTAFAEQVSLSLIPEGEQGAASIVSGAEGGSDDVLALRSEATPSVDGGGAATTSENVNDTNDGSDHVISNEANESERSGEITLPAATERINEDMVLTTRTVAQAESTRSYFLAQTLESTRTVPIVSANLPLDTGDAVMSNEAFEDEGSGEGSDDPDSVNPNRAISNEVCESERSGEISGASIVFGSFIQRGITYAIEPGGETVAVVAADYAKFPFEFAETQVIVVPSMVTNDSIDYYSVNRIANNAFASVNSQNGRESIETIAIPASVTIIDKDAFAHFDTLQYIVVSEDNPNYSQYDGCLYDIDQTSLLLIPEGRSGAVRIAPTTKTILDIMSSHCASVTSFVVDHDSAASQLLQDNDFYNANDDKIGIAYSTTRISTRFEDDWIDRLSQLDLWSEDATATAVLNFLNERVASNSEQTVSKPNSAWTIVDTLTADESTAATKKIKSYSSSGFVVIGNHDDTNVGIVDNGVAGAGVPVGVFDGLSSLDLTAGSKYKYKGAGGRAAVYGADGVMRDLSLPYANIGFDPIAGMYVTVRRITTGTPSTGNFSYYGFGYAVDGKNFVAPFCSKAVVLKRSSSLTADKLLAEFGISRALDTNNATYLYDYAIVLCGSSPDVMLDYNGGFYGSESDAVTKVGSFPFTLPAPTRSGSTFAGWKPSNYGNIAGANGTSTLTSGYYASNSTLRILKGVTLTAQWNATVTWDADGGAPTASTTTQLVGSKHKAPAFTRVGYTLEGWFTGKNGTGAKVAEANGQTFEAVSEHVTYYANWIPDTYAIKWNDANGTKLYDDETVGYEGSINLPAPTRVGHAFTGWVADVDGKTYTGSSVSVSDLVKTVGFTGPIVFTATWNNADYTFKLVDKGFGLNDDEPAVDSSLGSFTVSTSKTLSQGADAKFKAKEPSRTGYDFVGFYWHPGQSDERSFYVADSDYVDVPGVTDETNASWWSLACFEGEDSAKSVTLEAVWQPIIYTIAWDYNWRGGTNPYVYEEDGADKQAVTMDVAFGSAIEVPSVTDPGYDFIGWKTGESADKPTAARPKATFSDGRTDTTAASYSSDWFAQKDGEVLFKPAAATTVPSRETVRFYAHFSDEPTLFRYRVYLSRPADDAHGEFVVNSIALGTDEQNRTYYSDFYEYGKGVDLSSLAADGSVIGWDDGWTLLGFTDDATSTGLGTVVADKKAMGTQSFYALWSADEFTVTLSLATLEQDGAYTVPEGATLNGSDARTYSIDYGVQDDAMLASLPTPTGTVGHHFRGWRLLAGDGSFVEGAPVIDGIPSVKEYLDGLFADGLAEEMRHAAYGAVWEPYRYNVYFWVNRSSTDDECNVLPVEYGEELVFPAPCTKRPGYIFRAWQPSAGQYMERFDTWRSEESIPIERFVKRWAETTGASPALDPETADGSFRIDLYANWCQPVSTDIPLTVNVLLDPWNPNAPEGRGKVITNDSGINGGEAFEREDSLVNAWVGTDKDYAQGGFPGASGNYELRIEALTYLPAGAEAGDAVTTNEMFTPSGSSDTDAGDFSILLYAGGKREGVSDNVLSVPLDSGRLEFSRAALSEYGLDATIGRGNPLYLYYDLDLGSVMTLSKYEKLMEMLDKTDTRVDQSVYRLSRPIAHFYYTVGLVPIS